jgi:hypothetical protein
MNRKYKHSSIKLETLRELRRMRDELVEAMPAGRRKWELQAKAKNRTDLDDWNDATRGCKQLRLL